MNTIASESPKSCRRRRTHGAEFKAQAVAACRPAGVSIAAIAMANGVNANLLRRWIIEADQQPASRPALIVPAKATPSFIPVVMGERTVAPDIRVELRRGSTAITVTWPTTAAAECAAWMRELLR